MGMEIWKPNVTVAAVVERDGRFLVVEEETDDGLRFNQPAGHLERGESLVAAAAREALEETAHRFRPEFLVGIYQWPKPAATSPTCALRSAAASRASSRSDARRRHRAGGVAELDELRATRERHRSPLILQCCEDYLAGRRFPLDLLRHYDA
jgi:8-oxo-dGTP pyrophosphatase MutT (NUDIX family)